MDLEKIMINDDIDLETEVIDIDEINENIIQNNNDLLIENEELDEYGIPILDEYGIPIEKEDEDVAMEIRRIVSEKSFTNNYETITIEKKQKQKSNKQKKTLSLSELNTVINKQIEDNAPKKFISKRTLEKKKTDSQPIQKFINKRLFQPRIIPYLFSDQYKNKRNTKNNLDDEHFPLL